MPNDLYNEDYCEVFLCTSDSMTIPKMYFCDGSILNQTGDKEADCTDGSDEDFYVCCDANDPEYPYSAYSETYC